MTQWKLTILVVLDCPLLVSSCSRARETTDGGCARLLEPQGAIGSVCLRPGADDTALNSLIKDHR